MAASVLACLILIFLPLSLCFSNSCTRTLPCKPSLQIMPPFYFQDDIDPNCHSFLSVWCDKIKNISFIVLRHDWSLPLESISYNPNIIRVQDPNLGSSLDKSGCANLYFNFTTPVTDFRYDHEMYEKLNFSLLSMRCQPSNQIQSPVPAGVFGVQYNLSFSPPPDEDDVYSKNCWRPDGSPPSFEYVLSFQNEIAELSLQSANYSRDLRAQPGCFAHSMEMEISGCHHGKGECFSKRKKTIIGSVAGSVFLLSFLCLFLLLYKRKKLRSSSSSSEHLVQRESSDQYFHDLEMSGLGCTQIFSYEDLEEATEGFSASKELGNGGFGTVYKGILKDGRTVAVKLLYKNNYKRIEQFENEVEILSHLHHPNLVTLYGCSARTSHELLLVYEFVPNGTVADHLHGARSSENALTWPVRLSIAIETANALAYLHAVEPPIIHRDVKSNNILLDDRFHVKVADFGLSRLFPLDVTHVSTVPQGTPGYVDPVYHQCYHLTDKSDVYSFGVVLVELISSKLAVDLNRTKDEINLASLAVNKIQMSQLEELVDPALGFRSNWEVRRMVSLVAELAFRCLQYDREMRPPIKEVYETLKEIEQGSYSGDELLKENMTKEETYLLKCDPNVSSSDIMTDSWRSSSTTPNTSR